MRKFKSDEVEQITAIAKKIAEETIKKVMDEITTSKKSTKKTQE